VERPGLLLSRDFSQGCQRRGTCLDKRWRLILLYRNALSYFNDSCSFQQHLDDLVPGEPSKWTDFSHLLHLRINIITQFGSLHKVIPAKSSAFIRGRAGRVTNTGRDKPPDDFSAYRAPASSFVFCFRPIRLGMLVIFSRTAPFDECHVVSVTCKEMLILNVTNRCPISILDSLFVGLKDSVLLCDFKLVLSS
jgi:hypothetical protein